MTLYLDDRLLHGRILHGWASRLGSGPIVLISERLADPLLRSSYGAIGAAEGWELFCLTPREAAAQAAKPDEFRLTDSAAAAWTYRQAGGRFERLLLIGLRDPGGELLAEELSIGAESRRLLAALADAGVKVLAQRFPHEASRPLLLGPSTQAP